MLGSRGQAGLLTTVYHIHRETARKSQRTKRQTSLKTPVSSLLLLCGGEHRLELVHREAERGLASL